MALKPGTILGHYEIVVLIGVGGMGEVYRAHDTVLARDVALKVLPEAFARDPDRIARFRREARLLASLNHTNIAAIYGLEEDHGTHFLVMELVLGDTLRDRITRDGPVPLEETLSIGQQIAEALEHAHEKTVIHRDLKPANVKVTPEGLVKVLDFGLAKAFAAAESESDIENAPTLSASPTIPGAILGTPAYMSPEQAKGKKVDRRTDIWALGCVLFELLTGKQAFAGEDISDTLASVLKSDPDWQGLPADAPAHLRFLLRRCLEKDATRRFRDASDVRIEIEEALAAPAPPAPIPIAPALPAKPRWQPAALWAAASLAACILTGLAVWTLKPSTPSIRPSVARFVVSLPANQPLAPERCPSVALSPDGRFLAYVAVGDGWQQLYLRAMDSLEARPIPGATGALVSPFFSPDGQWLGFWADAELRKVSTSGGASVTLARPGVCGMGASWGIGDRILFGSVTGLRQISANGGQPQVLTAINSQKGERSYAFPEFLPGGKAVLFTVHTGTRANEGQVVAQRLDTGERRVLIQGGSNAHYLPTGHLVYGQAGNLMAVPFDLQRLELMGASVPIVEGVMQTPYGPPQFSLSNLGTLVYIPGASQAVERRLVWVDRKGKAEPLPAPARAYELPRISPDGERIAVALEEDIWVYDISRYTLTRLTFEGGNLWPVWTPDGKRLTFQSSRAGPWNLFWKPADGSGALERLTTSEYIHAPMSWSPDGKLLAFAEVHPTTDRDIWVLPLEGERKPRPFLQTPYVEAGAMFSPDGRWLAYVSNESGRFEIYVQPFPGPGRKWQISTESGTEPVWARSGRELFYRNGDKMMAVDLTTGPAFSPGKPRQRFEAQYELVAIPPYANYDVSPDGQRFLMIRPSEQATATAQIHVVLNWFEELKRRVPATL